MLRTALRIHLPSYPELPLAGIEHYADRAMLLLGIAFVRAGVELNEYCWFLKDLGIGAEIVIPVPEDNLYQGILKSIELRSAVRCFAALGGGKIQFFNSTRREDEFLKELDLSWEDTISAPPEISAIADNKVALRILAADLGFAYLFPQYIFCETRAQVLAAVDKIQEESKPDFIVLKRPDLASGLGLVKLRTDEKSIMEAQVESYFAKYGEKRQLILEAGYDHIPLSVLWEINAEKSKALSVTRQILDKHFVHQGNIISSALPPGVTVSLGDELIQKSSPLAEALRERGYRGICGFDFIKTAQDRLFALECNGRMTASAYAYGLMEQIERDRGGKPWAVHMQNLYPKGARDWSELRKKLKPDLFDGQYGILPFNVRCLSLPESKCAVMCVAETVDEAVALYNLAKDRT